MATPVRAAPMPPAPLRALTSLAAALAAACALAQAPSSPPPADPPPTPLPAEYSDAARKAYVAGLKEARELIAHGDTCQVLTADNLHSARHMCGSFDRHAEQCLRGVA